MERLQLKAKPDNEEGIKENLEGYPSFALYKLFGWEGTIDVSKQKNAVLT